MGQRFHKQTIRDVDIERQVVLVRVDYNVPLNDDGTIADDLRIRASLPTLEYLLDKQCKLVLISHLGRPNGRDKKLSLEPVAARLAELLGRSVRFVDDCVGDKVRQIVRHSPCGSVILLENLRFYKEEEADDMVFAKSLTKNSGAAFFVQDGFGVAHRAHASTHAITLCLPSFAGFLVEKEYKIITQAMQQPARPLVAIIGGVKVSDKIDLIKQFVDKADRILIGGAMANTFLNFKGYNMGRSVIDPGQEAALREIYDLAAKKAGPANVDDFLVLPEDVAVGRSLDDPDQARKETPIDKIDDQELAMDIGSQAIERFSRIIGGAGTVVWNGPMGVYAIKDFSFGSARIALAIAENHQAVSIVGGGDTADFVLDWDGEGGVKFTHVSTGGGASMELMAGQKLPGIESLLDEYGYRMLN